MLRLWFLRICFEFVGRPWLLQRVKSDIDILLHGSFVRHESYIITCNCYIILIINLKYLENGPFERIRLRNTYCAYFVVLGTFHVLTAFFCRLPYILFNFIFMNHRTEHFLDYYSCRVFVVLF